MSGVEWLLILAAWLIILTVAVALCRAAARADERYEEPDWRARDHGSYEDWHSTSPKHPTHTRWTDW